MLAAVAKLPPHAGLTYRGLADETDIPSSPCGIRVLLATSRDPKVATANGKLPVLLAIVSRTGRALRELSAHPEEHEVVFLPGTVLVPVTSVDVGEVGVKLVLLDEADVHGEAGHEVLDGAQLLGRAIADVYASHSRPRVASANLAKFSGPIH